MSCVKLNLTKADPQKTPNTSTLALLSTICVKLNSKADHQKQPNTCTPDLLSSAAIYGYNKDGVEEMVTGIFFENLTPRVFNLEFKVSSRILSK